MVANAIYTVDKAYVDFEALIHIDEEGGFFVTRAKDNMKYEVITSNFNIDEQSGLRGDHSIRLTGYKSSKLYPKKLRLVEYSDIESGEKLLFITNIYDCLGLNGLEIAEIYRHRWDIESFFYDKHIIMQS